MDNSVVDVTSLFVDTDEVSSSSRPTTPSLFHQRLKINHASTVAQEKEDSRLENAQFSRKQDKLLKIERKREKKEQKMEAKRERKGRNSNPDFNTQNGEAAREVTTKAPHKPTFDLAGNIVTRPPPVKQTTSDDVLLPGTTKSPHSWLDVGPPLILLTTKSPDAGTAAPDSTRVPVKTTPSTPVSTRSSTTSSTGSSVFGGHSPPPPSSTPSTADPQVDKGGPDNDKLLDRWRKRQARRLKCPNEEKYFRNSPEGYRCCIKSAKCFENLPDDIDDVSEASNQNADPATGNYSEACGKINESLVCMASVLGRDKCVSAAEIVNKDLREELVMVKDFHRRHCQGLTAGQSTVSSVPGGQGQMSTSGSSSLPTSAVIGAAIGGIFVLILIIAIVCFARRKKSSPPMQDKVAFHHSPEPSTRYKEFMRTNSEVYAEIDEKHLQRSFRASDDTTTFEKMEGSGGSTGSRPLPTAPSGGLDEDKAGYLTPKLSRENLNDKTGYDELSNVSINEGSCADSYDKLARTKTDYEPEAIDGDYITPESEPTEEKKNPENSHTYFVLEK
ncbi:uncharacterized protein LOC128161664 isoform X2 [Crassostrea angulata]|uniref:uncharacterized protein LOC128161664 isoform X2 n=1 Tax=Magallana angulata TaxID=2784310 RepID=UPI0022B1E795|nr:uncharacterized protein LOC128161664 isoform X2 [Crassostrea angulata]